MSRIKSQSGQEPPATRLTSFGEWNFGDAELGDKRRTKRLVQVADALVRHPGGSFPEKLRGPGELDGFYHLMKGKAVTHESVMAPHRARTLQKIAEHDGPVLVLHDTTELDYTTRESLDNAGPIGNGSRKGWLCHNSLVVSPQQREVLGLSSQILHHRATVRKKESTKARRERLDRESRLWLEGTKTLPANRKIVDVCDRGADTFEFLAHEIRSNRTFVVRSSHNRGILPEQEHSSERVLLHDLSRSLPSLGQWTLSVPAARLVKKPKKTGKNKVIHRQKREAQLQVSARSVEVCRPQEKTGDYDEDRLLLWIVRVWEEDPPEGVEGLEWFLLTNHPVESFEAAREVVGWYECRWMIEEFHKAQKTGCSIESPQFSYSDRLHPAIALLSIVALSLLNLRELSRLEDAKTRPASEVISGDYVNLLSTWRRGKEIPDWTIHDFFMALARLGGHLNRKHDGHPGWIVLWRGWSQLQLMMEGVNAFKKLKTCA